MKITKETIISTALIVLSLINQILTMFGKSPLPIEDEFVANVISIIFLVATTAYSWWHNNSVTNAAKLGDKIVKALKNGTISETKVQELITWIESDELVDDIEVEDGTDWSEALKEEFEDVDE